MLFNKYETALHKCCHGNTWYLPFAISVLEERVKSWKPKIDVQFTELVPSKYSTDAVSPDKEIMLMLTDGGGGHNITRISAQVSQICLSFN